MDKLHEGYYAYTEGLGEFFKNIVTNENYLIHRLEIKVDVIDAEFENYIFVKTPCLFWIVRSLTTLQQSFCPA